MRPDDSRESPPPAPRALPALPPAARERAIARLSAAFADDALSIDEFEERVAAAYAAASEASLQALVADLPADIAAPAAVVPAAQSRRITAVLGSVERRGPIDVPERLQVKAVFGSVELDLRDARFASGITEIALEVTFGSVDIRLPAHAQVEAEARSFLASVDCLVPRGSTPGTGERVVVRLTGSVVLGAVEVRVDPG